MARCRRCSKTWDEDGFAKTSTIVARGAWASASTRRATSPGTANSGSSDSTNCPARTSSSTSASFPAISASMFPTISSASAGFPPACFTTSLISQR